MKKRKQSQTAVPQAAVPRRLRWWPFALGLIVILGVGASAMFMPGADAPFINTTPPPGPAPEGMVWVPGGQFWMGDPEFEDAQPIHPVYVDGFWMDRTEVTNEQFARFVNETGYVTVAERVPRREDFPEYLQDRLQPELMVPGAMVFRPPPGKKSAKQCTSCYEWWEYVPKANWRHPQGPDSSIEGKEKHPVVQVCWQDAVAYARWAGKRLPTEAEWEFAARGGLDRQAYPWGSELTPGSEWQLNIWQGEFPGENTNADGFATTAPVGSFAPNGFGLFDMAGNAWEWCADWYKPDYYAAAPRRNPQGPRDSVDPEGSGMPKRVQRGGSYLCSDNYCVRYRIGGRGHGDPDNSMAHTGFRCVK